MVNIGIEGMMLTAAFFGFMAEVYTKNLAIAVLAAMASSALMALLHAALSIVPRRPDHQRHGDQHPGRGTHGYLNRQLFATGAPPAVGDTADRHSALSDLPWVGPILFQQKPIR